MESLLKPVPRRIFLTVQNTVIRVICWPQYQVKTGIVQQPFNRNLKTNFLQMKAACGLRL